MDPEKEKRMWSLRSSDMINSIISHPDMTIRKENHNLFWTRAINMRQFDRARIYSEIFLKSY